MGDSKPHQNHHHDQLLNPAADVLPEPASDILINDDPTNRSGTLWTATAHIITAVVGSGVLSLAWAMAQLGWIAGPAVMLLFAIVTYYTSALLADCYRSGDPLIGKRNPTYMEAVRSNLGGVHEKLCGVIQHINLYVAGISYTIAASISMMAIKRSNCFHESGGKNPCQMSPNLYIIIFGIAEVFLSQIPEFDQITWLSAVATAMSFTYSAIGLGLGVAQVAENGWKIEGSLTGISIGDVTKIDKIWRVFQALGNIAFAYGFSMILIEIQDTVKSPPSESKTMKKATLISITVTTVFYLLCGCMGYAAFGDTSPGNLLTGFGFYNPYWLLDIGNAAIVIHLVGAYQVYSQPLFAFIEKQAASRFPELGCVTHEIRISIPGRMPYNLNLFRLVMRTMFVISTTVISMAMPFFNDVVGLVGSLGFWPITVYFPIEMCIRQSGIPKWSVKWVCLEGLSLACLAVTVAAIVGSVAGIVEDLKTYKIFGSVY